MAINYLTSVAVEHSGGSGAGTATSTAINTTGATLLVAAISASEAISAAPTDSQNNTWSGPVAATSNGSQITFYWTLPGSKVSSSHTFTTPSQYYCSMPVLVFGGSVTTGNPVENSAVNNGGGLGSLTSLQPGSITPQSVGDVFVTLISTTGAGTVSAMSIDSSFTTPQIDWTTPGPTGTPYAVAYKITTTGAAENPTWSWTGNTFAECNMAVFQTQSGDTLQSTGAWQVVIG